MAATLGQLIRDRRMELNLTQEELAERVGDGVRQSEISRLERNRVTLPRRRRMEELAAALDIPVGLLLARSGWVGAEVIDGEDPEPVDADPASKLNEVEQATREPHVKPDGLPFPDHDFRNDHHHILTSPLEDSPHLNEAILRAEALIGKSRAIYTEAQTTISEARESVKRRQLNDS